MARKWMKCQKQKEDIETVLVGHDLPTLWNEWNAQVAVQTKPSPSKCFLFFMVVIVLT